MCKLSYRILVIWGLGVSTALGGCALGRTQQSLPATPVATPAQTVSQAQSPEHLVQSLRQGGYVIYFRHAATDFSMRDRDRQNLNNCQTQRNLNAQGRSESRAIGQAFQALQIPVGRVLASPYCRTLETARLAFGRAEPSRALISPFSVPGEAGRRALNAGLRQQLASAPTAGTNTVIVSHERNLQAVTDLSIAEGEAVIFAPLGSSQFRQVARVLPNQWTRLRSRG